MRSITKRLTVVNAGSSLKAAKKNEKSIQKVIDRYIAKMTKKGWLFDYATCGDSFFEYQAFVTMYK